MSIIGITGGTGFIGTHLTRQLLAKGHTVVMLTRSPEKRKPGAGVSYALFDPGKKQCDIKALININAVINLAGAGVADKRWTDERKKEIVESRVTGTSYLVSMLQQYAPECKTMIAASATGYYGADKGGRLPFTEDSPPARDFLADTCRQWEAASQSANSFLRVIIMRIGIVLGREGGAFPQFAGPLRIGIMPILGSGNQVVSWIEAGDLAGLMIYAVENEAMSGVYNGVAPSPVTNRMLMKAIAAVKGGISIPMPVPAFALKMGMGEMSEEVLKSCTVSAQKTLASGFKFRYPEVRQAVGAILKG